MILQSFFIEFGAKKALMRIPLTKYGLRELIALPVLFYGIAILVAALSSSGWIWPMAIASILTLAGWAFFRDFEREIPSDDNILIAPADGKVTDIKDLEESEFINQDATRIGIFLSVLDVHVNRTPCTGQVKFIKEVPGLCLNALNSEEASKHNQSTQMGLDCPDHPAGKVLVKQITGAIARRIVCAVKPEDKLVAGQRYGMIKFGSRTELYFPKNEKAQILVKPGDKVRGGKTIMVRFE